MNKNKTRKGEKIRDTMKEREKKNIENTRIAEIGRLHVYVVCVCVCVYNIIYISWIEYVKNGIHDASPPPPSSLFPPSHFVILHSQPYLTSSQSCLYF